MLWTEKEWSNIVEKLSDCECGGNDYTISVDNLLKHCNNCMKVTNK